MKLKDLGPAACEFFQAQGFNLDDNISTALNNHGDMPLTCAIQHHKNEFVPELIKATTDITIPLHMACGIGNIEAIDLFLKSNPSLIRFEDQDPMGLTLLMMAFAVPMTKENESSVYNAGKFLVEKGVKIDQINPKDGYTALLYAAQYGHHRAVEYLVQQKANIKHTSREGLSALLCAIGKETGKDHFPQVIQILLQDPNINIEQPDVNGNTPLHCAAQDGHADLVEKLIERKANIEARCLFGKTPVHQAAYGGHLEVVKALVAAKADVNTMDSVGMSTAGAATIKGHKKVIKYLIKQKASLEIGSKGRLFSSGQDLVQHLQSALAFVNSTPPEQCRDAIARLSQSQNSATTHPAMVASSLLDTARLSDAVRGLRTNATSSKSMTKVVKKKLILPLCRAAANNDLEKIRSLVKAGADINAMHAHDEKTASALLYACHAGHFEATKLLIELKADCTLRGSSGDTPFEVIKKKHSDRQAEFAPLFGITLTTSSSASANNADVKISHEQITYQLCEAAANNNLENIRKLVSSGANINAMRVTGTKAAAPLHYACHSGHFEAAKLLIELKADPTLKSSSGDTPLDKVRKAHPEQQPKFAPLFDGTLAAALHSTHSVSSKGDKTRKSKN